MINKVDLTLLVYLNRNVFHKSLSPNPRSCFLISKSGPKHILLSIDRWAMKWTQLQTIDVAGDLWEKPWFRSGHNRTDDDDGGGEKEFAQFN